MDDSRKNQFILDLQTHSAFSGTMSMWETVLHIKYEDFELGNEDMIILKDLIIQFKKNLQNQCEELCGSFLYSFPIPGTEEQALSDVWFSNGWPRITAPRCFRISSLGKAIIEGHSNTKQHCYNFLRCHFWFKEEITTADMQYGIKEESAAKGCI